MFLSRTCRCPHHRSESAAGILPGAQGFTPIPGRACLQTYTLRPHSRVDSRKLEHEFRVIYADCPSSLGFEDGGRSYSNFVVSTVGVVCMLGARGHVFNFVLSRRLVGDTILAWLHGKDKELLRGQLLWLGSI